MNRRQCCAAFAAGGAVASLTRSAQASALNIRVDTYTYKRVGSLEIKADVHRADDEVALALGVGANSAIFSVVRPGSGGRSVGPHTWLASPCRTPCGPNPALHPTGRARRLPRVQSLFNPAGG